MADFSTWKFASLVAFAQETHARIVELEQDNQELRQYCEDLRVELRKIIAKEIPS